MSHDGNCKTCREERERASEEVAEDLIADGLARQYGEDTSLLEFYNLCPNAVSFGVGALHQPGAWAWFDAGHVARVATDLRDALRKAKNSRER